MEHRHSNADNGPGFRHQGSQRTAHRTPQANRANRG